MERLIFFGILSLPVIILSWRALFSIKNHGFFRFFSWECIIWLFVNNYKFWFDHPLSTKQIFSWVLLLYSIYLVIYGARMIKKIGRPEKGRGEKELFEFEKTTELVDQGIFKYIRHPLYSSLLFLTWGIFLKNTSYSLFAVSLISTVFLYLTAILDEKECINFFGDKYREYMKRSKRFIPFIV
jgi:protein-S-isoprenylcysteine O-methyltransferase Ste14